MTLSGTSVPRVGYGSGRYVGGRYPSGVPYVDVQPSGTQQCHTADRVLPVYHCSACERCRFTGLADRQGSVENEVNQQCPIYNNNIFNDGKCQRALSARHLISQTRLTARVILFPKRNWRRRQHIYRTATYRTQRASTA